MTMQALFLKVNDKHPALKSIALVSIFGIASVVVISYAVLPLLFNLVTKIKGRERREPMTFSNWLISIISLLTFLINTITLTTLIPILYILHLYVDNCASFYPPSPGV